MIWVDGRIVPDQSLTVSVLDRTFEHGLGLFETMRTWRGRAPLLDRHLARLTASAKELGLPLEPSALPDSAAVASLLAANGIAGDAVLRLTLTGGVSESTGSRLWMRSAPLPPPSAPGGAVVDFGSWTVDRNDPLLRHKSLNYWRRRLAHQHAREIGFDEVLSMSDGRCFWEGSRTNLFLVIEDLLITPALSGPIVPGIMRGLVLELGRSHRLKIREVSELDLTYLEEAHEAFLTNSVRGLMPVSRIGEMTWDVPGRITQGLAQAVTQWLNQGETR